MFWKVTINTEIHKKLFLALGFILFLNLFYNCLLFSGPPSGDEEPKNKYTEILKQQKYFDLSEAPTAFYIGDKPFIFMGGFLPGWHWGDEWWYASENLILTAKDNGINVLHIMLPWFESQLGEFDEAELVKLDFFLDYASIYGVYVIISLIQGYGLAIQPSDPYYNPGGIEGLIKNKKLKQALKKRISKLLLRRNAVNQKIYRDDPVIMAWNLVDEPISAPWNYPIRPPHVSISELRRWFDQMASYIRTYDKNHLVTVYTTAAIDTIGTDWLSLFNVSNLDFIIAEDADGRILNIHAEADDYPLRLLTLPKPIVVELSFFGGGWNQKEIAEDYKQQAQIIRKSAKKYFNLNASGVIIASWGSSNYGQPPPECFNYNAGIKPICRVIKRFAKNKGTLHWPIPPLQFVRIY